MSQKISTVNYEDGLKERIKNPEYAYRLIDYLSKENAMLAKRLKYACDALREVVPFIDPHAKGPFVNPEKLADALEKLPSEDDSNLCG